MQTFQIIPAAIEEVEARRKELSAEWSALKTGLKERVREFLDLCARHAPEEEIRSAYIEISRYREEIDKREEGIVLLDRTRVSLQREELLAA